MKGSKHLFNTKFWKIFWFVKRFGISQLFMKPIRIILAPLILKWMKPKEFFLENKKYKTFYHRYNTTWANERAVEVPVIKAIVDKEKGRILEVGNVLSHYFNVSWDILDKFEKANEVINQDVVNFKPEKKYDLIVSISTFEHIGFDDEIAEKSAEKIMKSFNNLKENCLDKVGNIVITVPIGYNNEIDKLIIENKFNFKKQLFMKRLSKNKWGEVSVKEAFECKYGKPHPYANAIMFGFFENQY